MISGSPGKVREKLVHRYSRLSGKKTKVRKHFEQIEKKKKSALSIRTSKGTLSFGAMLFSLHKYCYSTAPLQGPEKLCARSPIGTDNWNKHMHKISISSMVCVPVVPQLQVFDSWSTCGRALKHLSVSLSKGKGWGKRVGKESTTL